MSAKEPRVAVVTGANRGIGLEVCRQLAERGMTVMLTSRDRHSGETAALHLAELGLDVRAEPLDVADSVSVERFAGWARARLGHVDVPVNNAAIDYDTDQRAVAATWSASSVPRRPTPSAPGGSRSRCCRYCAPGRTRGSSTSPAKRARSARSAPAPRATA